MRAFLGGRAVPRDEFALIGLGGGGPSSGIAIVLLLEDGDVFHPADYISLGYTNYEVDCIGAAGGRGGAQASTGGPVPGNPVAYASGGAGGGGGLHRAIGLLEDLPDDVLATVGQPGADGRNSNSASPYFGKLNTSAQFDYVLDADGYAIDLPILDNPSYVSPLDGDDGGKSAFGSVCHASGGKGGKAARLGFVVPHPLWGVAYTGGYGGLFMTLYSLPGDGGDGGVGNQDAAGGGGDRGILVHTPMGFTYGPDLVNIGGGRTRQVTHTTLATSVYTGPKDGGWDSHIGGGGGGGYGAIRTSFHDPSGDPFTLTFGTPKEAKSGAKGSMNYADTSRYGPGEAVRVDGTGVLTVPGGGGGAKLNKLARYGSHAVGYDPKGAVQIRLTKVE